MWPRVDRGGIFSLSVLAGPPLAAPQEISQVAAKDIFAGSEIYEQLQKRSYGGQRLEQAPLQTGEAAE